MTSETQAQLEARIRSAFPRLEFAQAELNDYGEDNRIVVLDGQWIVRIPRNDTYRARFAAELNLLEALRAVTAVAVPHYEFVAPDFGAYRMIAGTEMTPPVFRALEASAQRAVLARLGEFLTALHRLPAKTIAQPDGLSAQASSGEYFAALYRGTRRAKIARVVDARTLARFDDFHQAYEAIAAGAPRLVHGDISDDHILVAPDRGALGGIIDFSDASFGDAAGDFAYFWRLGEAAVDTALANYGLAAQDAGLKTRSHWIVVRYLISQIAHGARAKWNLPVDEALAELDLHLKQLGF